MTRGLLRGLLLFAWCASLLGCGTAERATAEGDRLLRDNDLVGAENAYNRAILIDPHHGPALYGKGWALYLSGHEQLHDASRQLFQRCIDYDPEYFGGYRGMGAILMDEGKVALAERMLRTAFEKKADEPTTLTSLGQLYLGADRLDEAERLFQAAASLAPERGELLRYLADLEVARGNHDLALQWIAQGRSRPVSGRRGLLTLDEGEVRVHLDHAATLLKRATGPQDPDLGLALQALDAADSLLERAIQADSRLRGIGPRRKYHEALRRQIEEAARP